MSNENFKNKIINHIQEENLIPKSKFYFTFQYSLVTCLFVLLIVAFSFVFSSTLYFIGKLNSDLLYYLVWWDIEVWIIYIPWFWMLLSALIIYCFVKLWPQTKILYRYSIHKALIIVVLFSFMIGYILNENFHSGEYLDNSFGLTYEEKLEKIFTKRKVEQFKNLVN